LRKLFGLNRKKLTKYCIKHTIKSTLTTSITSKYEGVVLKEDVASMGETRKTQRILMGKLEGMTQLGYT
jgi:hypothetical protein